MLIIGDERYFLVENKKGYRFVVPAICPHRGGPLYMGTMDDGGTCIRCPWHNLNTPINSLTRRALPSVRIGKQWTVRIPSQCDKSQCHIIPAEHMQVHQQNTTC